VKKPVSSSQVARFMQFMAEWQAKLGLTSWRLELQIDPPDHRSTIVEIDMSHAARLLKVRVAREDWGDVPVTEQRMREIALHEMGHVLLDPLIQAVKAHDIESPEVEEAEHAVIATLTNLMYRKVA
jgi:RNA-binding protein YlmH